MKKFLLRVLIVVVLAFVGGQAFLWLLAHQGMQKLQASHIDSGSFDYGHGTASLDGTLSFNGLYYTSFVLKRSGTAESLIIDFGDLYSLFNAVTGERASMLEAVKSISITGARLENEGRQLSEWIKTEFHQESLSLINLYGGCASTNSIDQQILADMGIPEIQFDASVKIDSEKGAPSPITIEADFKALGAWKFTTDITFNELAHSNDLKSLSLSKFDLQFNDQGFFRRLSNYCEQKNRLNREDFALLASQQWQAKLSGAGVVVSDGLAEFYRDFLQYGGLGVFTAKLNSKKALSSWFSYNTDLLADWSFEPSLNGRAYQGGQLTLLSSYFDPAESEEIARKNQELLEQKRKALEQQRPSRLRWSLENKKAEEAAKAELAELEKEGINVLGNAGFAPLNDFQIDDLSSYIGLTLKVDLTDGKTYEGQLIKVDKFLIELDKPVKGGKLSYSIDIDKISAIDVALK